MLAVLAVPGGFSTIQDAIDHARGGDTVQIADGVYEESLDLSRMGSAVGGATGNLLLQGDSPAVVVRVAEGAALFNSASFDSDLRVRQVTLESSGSTATTAGIALADISGSVELRDLIFRNLTGAALRVENVVGELFVANNAFEATGGQMRSDTLHVKDLIGTGVIHDNQFTDVTGTAIRIEQSGSAATLMISANDITGDGSFFQTTGDGIVVSSSGDAQLDLSLDRNQLKNLGGRGVDVRVQDQAGLQSRWTRNTLQQIRGDSALELHVEDSGEAALAVFGNSVLDAFGDGMSVILEQAADARAVIRDNLFLGIGAGEAKAGLTIATTADATGTLAVLVDNNSIDTIAGNGLQVLVDGAATAAFALTDNFFTGTNTTGGTDALVVQSASDSMAAVRARVSGNQVLDSLGGAYRLSNLGGSLALAGSSQAPDEELAATNQGEPVNIDGAVQLIAADSLDAVVPLLLGDFVWLDENGNGIADGGEPGQPFVRVNLSGADSSGGTVERTTLTDSAGNYYFSALLPGAYSLALESPLGFRLTAANQGSDDEVDSDFDRATMSVQVTLATASGDLTFDAGLEQTWQNPANRLDVNGDGFVSPIDALQLINEINDNGSYELPIPYVAPDVPPPYLDVDGDGFIAPIDVLQVINHLNEAVGEGEGRRSIIPPPAMTNGLAGIEAEQLLRVRRAAASRVAAPPHEGTSQQPLAGQATFRLSSTVRPPKCSLAPMLGAPRTSPLDPQLVDHLMTEVD